MRFVFCGLLAAFCLSGCASAVRGINEKVVINAEPADAAIRTSIGHTCPASPCTVEVARKTPFTAYAEKPGFEPGEIFIDAKKSDAGGKAMAGNIIMGGLVGAAIDSSNGANLDHTPNPALIVLKPIGATVAPPSNSAPKKPKPAAKPIS